MPVLLAGCGGDSGGNNPSPAIVGRWRATSLTSGNKTVPCPGEIDAEGNDGTGLAFACSANEFVEFGADGTVRGVNEVGQYSGRYSLSGDRITFSGDGFAGEANTGSKFTVSEGGQRLTLTATYEGNISSSTIYTRQ